MSETKATGIRLSTEVIDEIQKRAARRKWSFNKWVNNAIASQLRRR